MTSVSEAKDQSFFPTAIAAEGRLKQPSNVEQPDSPSEEAVPRQDEPDISEELKLLLEEFNQYDGKQIGMIPCENVKEILTKLNYSLEDFDDIARYAIMTKEGWATFDEFLAIMSQIEKNAEEVDENKLFVKRELKTDRRLLGFLKLLDEYRRKCEKQGNYKEAKKSKTKIEEIREKESIRKKNTLKIVHNEEISSIEQIQKKQFQEFSESWDKFMSEYEQAALESLQKLKAKHIQDLEQFTARTREELSSKMYFSKQVLELRTKEKNLVKLQQYEEADKIRIKLETLENEERKLREQEIEQTMELKVSNFRKQQTSVLNALLKRIQKDRNQQLRQRQTDSQRLIVKNRNIRNDLVHKHQEQIKKAVDMLREFAKLNEQKQKKGNSSGSGWADPTKTADKKRAQSIRRDNNK